MVMLTETRPEVLVATMTTFISNSYDDLGETLTHMKILKLKSYLGENVTDYCAAILVDAESLVSDGAFKTEHLGHINSIFEDTSDSRFRLWDIQKYKEVTDFLNFFVCVTWMSYHKESSQHMNPLYKRLQEATREYRDLVD